MRGPSLQIAVLIVAISALTAAATAETLLVEQVQKSETASADLPARGMTMDRVEAAYGSPQTRHRPVGDPPITRWEYGAFIVYFENQHVIHTVPKRQARAF